MGRGELQRTIKRVFEERVQDSSATRSIRDREKTALTWAVLCGFSLVTGVTLGTMINAETSGKSNRFDIAGGVVGGLAFCAAAYLKMS